MTTGYSGTPQLKKLGLLPALNGSGVRWALDSSPEGWTFESEPDPGDRVTGSDPADVVLAFVREAAGIDPALARSERRIFPAGALWIAWPRKAGGHVSDVTENAIRDAALARGLVDVKVAAIDADWSGLKLVWRRENR